jgi:transcriptional regulator with XRE-family HTH domain
MAKPSLNIRTIRQAQGLSINRLADKAGVSLSGLSEAERGLKKPGYQWLCKVAQALNVSLDELVNK